MTGRIPRLWQPGNSQRRVFLPDFWMKLLEPAQSGSSQLPKYAARFEVDLRMSDGDVRQYLEKIYKLPVRDVRTRVEFGEIMWDIKDKRARRALWKERDKKFATVFFKKSFDTNIPDLFANRDDFEEQRKLMERLADDVAKNNEKYVNKDRNKVGEFFGV